MTTLHDFASQLVDEIYARNGATLPEPAVREELLKELTSLADGFLNRRVVEAMTEDSAERFSQLLDEPTVTPAIIQAFVAANVVDPEGVGRQALLEFRKLYLGEG